MKNIDNDISAHQASRARKLYRNELRRLIPATSDIQAFWAPEPGLGSAEIQKYVTDAEKDQESKPLKSGKRIRVFRTQLLGRDVILKRFDLHGIIEQAKYRFRHSRARRFWAAARTLQALNIPTPEPLGFLEFRAHGIPRRSYVITEFMSDAVQGRKWIENTYPTLPPSERRKFQTKLKDALLELYRHGIYHADTKSENILFCITRTAIPAVIMWIDLECVVCGVIPTKHQVVRNMVQLKGSFLEMVPEGDRCDFLRSMASTFPYLVEISTINKIRIWTHRRRTNEFRRICEPSNS